MIIYDQTFLSHSKIQKRLSCISKCPLFCVKNISKKQGKKQALLLFVLGCLKKTTIFPGDYITQLSLLCHYLQQGGD